MPDKNDMITYQQAAKIAGNSWSRVQSWVKDALLDDIEIAGKHFLSKSQVERMLAFRKQKNNYKWTDEWRSMRNNVVEE